MTLNTTGIIPTNSTRSTRSIHVIDSAHEAVRAAQEVARRHLPLSVWLAAADTETIAACPAGCCVPVSGPLARHLVSACTRLGDTVVHLGATDHQLVSAALLMGCRASATFTDPALAGVSWTRLARTHPEHDLQVADLRVTRLDDFLSVVDDLAGSVGLVVVEQTCQHGRVGQTKVADPLDLASVSALLKPGGHMAVVTGLHRAEDRVVDPAPEIIARAGRGGLVYLQHIIAVRDPARGEQLSPYLSRRALETAQALPECAGLPVSARCHSDVLLCTKPTGALSDPREAAAPTTRRVDRYRHHDADRG